MADKIKIVQFLLDNKHMFQSVADYAEPVVGSNVSYRFDMGKGKQSWYIGQVVNKINKKCTITFEDCETFTWSLQCWDH